MVDLFDVFKNNNKRCAYTCDPEARDDGPDATIFIIMYTYLFLNVYGEGMELKVKGTITLMMML